MTDPNVAPPLFTPAHPELSASTQAALANRGQIPSLNLDDIFGDVVFTPDGDTVFLSEQDAEGIQNSGEGPTVASYASRQDQSGSFRQVANAGGLVTTQLGQTGKPALAMGTASGVAPTKAVPFRHNPQAQHHLQYAAPKKSGDRKVNDQQKAERRYVTRPPFRQT